MKFYSLVACTFVSLIPLALCKPPTCDGDQVNLKNEFECLGPIIKDKLGGDTLTALRKLSKSKSVTDCVSTTDNIAGPVVLALRTFYSSRTEANLCALASIAAVAAKDAGDVKSKKVDNAKGEIDTKCSATSSGGGTTATDGPTCTGHQGDSVVALVSTVQSRMETVYAGGFAGTPSTPLPTELSTQLDATITRINAETCITGISTEVLTLLTSLTNSAATFDAIATVWTAIEVALVPPMTAASALNFEADVAAVIADLPTMDCKGSELLTTLNALTTVVNTQTAGSAGNKAAVDSLDTAISVVVDVCLPFVDSTKDIHELLTVVQKAAEAAALVTSSIPEEQYMHFADAARPVIEELAAETDGANILGDFAVNLKLRACGLATLTITGQGEDDAKLVPDKLATSPHNTAMGVECQCKGAFCGGTTCACDGSAFFGVSRSAYTCLDGWWYYVEGAALVQGVAASGGFDIDCTFDT